MKIGSRSSAAFLSLLLMGTIIASEGSRPRQLFQAKTACKPGFGGAACTACQPGTYSLGDTDCLKCPPQAMCMSMPGPCQQMPVCDATTGKATSMCWVNKPDGAACSPGQYGTDPLPAGAAATHTCQKGACERVTGAAKTQGTGSVAPSQTTPVKCPSTPACRMAQGPCDMAPTCDAQGRPTNSCWVSKPDGAQCNPNGGPVHSASPYVCRNRQCVMAAVPIPGVALPTLGNQRPQVLPPGPTQNRPQVLPIGPIQNKPQVLPVGPAATAPQKTTAAGSTSSGNASSSSVSCPTTVMCKMAQGPCDVPPPCDAQGKPTSMCWVPKPDGTVCSVNGVSGKCKGRVCEPAGH